MTAHKPMIVCDFLTKPVQYCSFATLDVYVYGYE
jgi:hypothetical protein